ncbi:MAG: hypothetical protein KGH64_03895 [Candidatus Micrarchaeota archaeon]|nr:hypothetical protein [Candidatus Micrarchaeota archaeon]MDE1834453.1 hypothetical protein [Candidatus Micrarchaeota archaeon]MDE1859071.1 hypothetical protein [Candidatus Micrarchaeota archaeon]
MKFYDFSKIEVDLQLQTRLGFAKIYSEKDMPIESTINQRGIAHIVISKSPDTLSKALRSPDVKGIIFEGNEFNKKIIEKAAEARKVILIPVSYLLWQNVHERQKAVHDIRKAISAIHKLKARAAIVTLAKDKESLLSRAQLGEVASMIAVNNGAKLFGGELFDN